MRTGQWHIAVLIPARDEERLLPGCLRSVQAARRRLPADVTSDLVVVSDCSRDRTCALAEAILGKTGQVLHTEAGSVGCARALAASAALARFAGERERCWLANTDADCTVPPDWLLDQLAMAARGNAAVAGIIDVDSFAEHGPEGRERFRETYAIHADGTHPHVHGANLGVRADAYLAAGGWRQQASGEDHDLWRRLLRNGVESLMDARLRVVTSGRQTGRAPQGFAAALAAHNASAA